MRLGAGMSTRIIAGDCLATLRTLPAVSVQCCVTRSNLVPLRVSL